MAAPYVLHMMTPLAHVSPFDVNMAADAGITTIVPYTGISLKEITGLTQDAMFSRDPRNAVRTGLFIGGRDASLALDMLEAAKKAMFPPFQISVFADPYGSFTTAAAMIAVVERALRRAGTADGLKGLEVQVYGATGVVGGIVGLIAAQAGAKVTLVSHRGVEGVQPKAEDFQRRYGVTLACVDRKAEGEALIGRADVVLAAAAAGVQVLSRADLERAGRLKVAADINAVPPLGVEGVNVQDDGVALPHGVGVGALAIGNIKFKVQHALLARMQEATKAVYLDFQHAVDTARDLTA